MTLNDHLSRDPVSLLEYELTEGRDSPLSPVPTARVSALVFWVRLFFVVGSCPVHCRTFLICVCVGAVLEFALRAT
jgi:hypothetical protein